MTTISPFWFVFFTFLPIFTMAIGEAIIGFKENRKELLYKKVRKSVKITNYIPL